MENSVIGKLQERKYFSHVSFESESNGKGNAVDGTGHKIHNDPFFILNQKNEGKQEFSREERVKVGRLFVVVKPPLLLEFT